MSNQKQQKPLCPFKRIIERDYSGQRGMTAMREKLDVCAGDRCMAYQRKDGTCKRLEPDHR